MTRRQFRGKAIRTLTLTGFLGGGQRDMTLAVVSRVPTMWYGIYVFR